MTRTNMYIPDEMLSRLKTVAQGRTLAAMVREALLLWLRTQERGASLHLHLPQNPNQDSLQG